MAKLKPTELKLHPAISTDDMLRLGQGLKSQGCLVKGTEFDALQMIAEWASEIMYREPPPLRLTEPPPEPAEQPA